LVIINIAYFYILLLMYQVYVIFAISE
jgi:hypothetical protein